MNRAQMQFKWTISIRYLHNGLPPPAIELSALLRRSDGMKGTVAVAVAQSTAKTTDITVSAGWLAEMTKSDFTKNVQRAEMQKAQ